MNRLSIDCVFDVGANRGQYGDLLRDIGYQGTIISFEPVKELFEELSLRAAARPPWKAFHYALGATDGEASINVNQDSVLSSFLTVQDNLEECPNSRAIRSETVQVRRLDTIFADTLSGLSPKNLHLKLDTQGFDLEALKGAEGVLSRFGSAQSEVSFVPVYKNMPDYIESLQAFQACGFGVADFMPVLTAPFGIAFGGGCEVPLLPNRTMLLSSTGSGTTPESSPCKKMPASPRPEPSVSMRPPANSSHSLMTTIFGTPIN